MVLGNINSPLQLLQRLKTQESTLAMIKNMNTAGRFKVLLSIFYRP